MMPLGKSAVLRPMGVKLVWIGSRSRSGVRTKSPARTYSPSSRRRTRAGSWHGKIMPRRVSTLSLGKDRSRICKTGSCQMHGAMDSPRMRRSMTHGSMMQGSMVYSPMRCSMNSSQRMVP